MAEDERHTLEEAVALKKRRADERETDYSKQWFSISILGSWEEATEFLNFDPGQGAGEAIVLDISSKEHGAALYVYYYA
jgi:hypothetical protein